MTTEVLAKVCQPNNLVEKLASRTELEYDVIVLPRFRKVDELDNIGVVKLSHYLDFFENIGALW